MQALSALWTVSLEIPILSAVDSAQTMGSDERRLVAIFAADVAGYSRLMRADEQGTLRALQADRGIIDSSISDHRGRIANTAGDSILAEFPSVVDAVDAL